MYNWTWRGKPVIPDHKRGVDAEMINKDVTMDEILLTLDEGVKVRKRKKGIIEKWWLQKRTIVIVAAEDEGDIWLLRHVNRIRATRKKVKLVMACMK